MTHPLEGHYCRQCGNRLDDAKLAKRPSTKFCSPRCAFDYRKSHPELYVKQRQATTASLKRRWKEWKAKGIDPAHGGEAAVRRGKKITESNIKNPRRKPKQKDPDPGG